MAKRVVVTGKTKEGKNTFFKNGDHYDFPDGFSPHVICGKCGDCKTCKLCQCKKKKKKGR